MPQTVDGYPYPNPAPPDDNWKWIKNPGSWTTNAAANKFLADIGERDQPGFRGLVQDIGARGFKWVAGIIGALISAIPIPGLQALGTAIVTAAANATKIEVAKLVEKGLKQAVDQLGVSAFVGKVTNLIYVKDSDMQTIRQKWTGLSDHSKSIVIHYIVDRWSWQRTEILSCDFSTTDGKKTFLTMLIAATCFDGFSWFNRWAGKPREFLAGEGVGLTLCHFASSNRWNPGLQSDVDTMRAVCLFASTIKVTNNQAEYDAFVAENQNPAVTEPPQAGKNTNLLIGGAIIAKLLKLL